MAKRIAIIIRDKGRLEVKSPQDPDHKTLYASSKEEAIAKYKEYLKKKDINKFGDLISCIEKIPVDDTNIVLRGVVVGNMPNCLFLACCPEVGRCEWGDCIWKAMRELVDTINRGWGHTVYPSRAWVEIIEMKEISDGKEKEGKEEKDGIQNSERI